MALCHCNCAVGKGICIDFYSIIRLHYSELSLIPGISQHNCRPRVEVELIIEFKPEPSNSGSVDTWAHVDYFLSSRVQSKGSFWSFPPYENNKPETIIIPIRQKDYCYEPSLGKSTLSQSHFVCLFNLCRRWMDLGELQWLILSLIRFDFSCSYYSRCSLLSEANQYSLWPLVCRYWSI